MSTLPAAIVEPVTVGPPVVPALVVEHLGRTFGRKSVLRDVSLRVETGQTLGLFGANGSGKTVLLRLLAALDRPTRGRAWILGYDTTRQARDVRRRIGYVPEKTLLYDGLSVEEYLDFIARARGMGTHVRRVSVTTLLQVVGLDNRPRALVGSLSPGERRRVALAGALVHEPQALLLDDPLRELDGRGRLEMLEVLRELKRLGTTTILAATRAEDVVELCDRVAVLRAGGIVWEGDLASIGTGAETVQRPGLRVRMQVMAGMEAAVELLRGRENVRELDLEDAPTVWLVFEDDREALPGLLSDLVQAGSSLASFGVEERSPAGALTAYLD